MPSDNVFHVCVLPGDGIGTEVTAAAVEVLTAVSRRSGQFALDFQYFAAGAEQYLESGVAMPDESWRGAEEADAILLGAMGLPRVRYDDGTEITPQLDLRFRFGLYAGVRPVSARRGGP
ncbi:MAG TPA: 3-isopropylmalate dehydrogenase, partial [Gammaproteobacteria bacterium]|nr:3-isopropylmalate dehydrogenase [Gammaproteobacteria bacterium]